MRLCWNTSLKSQAASMQSCAYVPRTKHQHKTKREDRALGVSGTFPADECSAYTLYYGTEFVAPRKGPTAQMGWVPVTVYLRHQRPLASLAEWVSIWWPWTEGCDHSLLLKDENWNGGLAPVLGATCPSQVSKAGGKTQAWHLFHGTERAQRFEVSHGTSWSSALA